MTEMTSDEAWRALDELHDLLIPGVDLNDFKDVLHEALHVVLAEHYGPEDYL